MGNRGHRWLQLRVRKRREDRHQEEELDLYRSHGTAPKSDIWSSP